MAVPALRRRVTAVARDLQNGAVDAAGLLVASLVREARPASASAGTPVDRLRAAALARVLLDLHHAGWSISLEDTQVYAVAPRFEPRLDASLHDAKDEVRRTMQARVREQVADPKAWRLAEQVEPHLLQVIADGDRLAHALATIGPAAVQPVLEPARVADGVDATTGLRRYDLFRYLRFLWNFPFGDVPGRTLPFLIRDNGQPGRPICGLLCFASPLLRLTSRDDDLGLTPAWLEAIVAGLDVDATGDHAGLRQRLQSHFEALAAALDRRRTAEGFGLTPGRILDDLAALLGFASAVSASSLARQLAALGAVEVERRTQDAGRRIVRDLTDDLLEAIRGIDVTAFGIEPAALLSAPARYIPALEEAAKEADKLWRQSRKVSPRVVAAMAAAQESLDVPGGRSEDLGDDPGADDDEDLLTIDGASYATAPPQVDLDPGDALLYAKKRARQLTALLKGWSGLQPLTALEQAPGPELLRALREATSRRRTSWLEADRRVLTGAAGMNRGLTEALLQRKVHMAATRIVDVAVCGAIPPYNDLLVGKLAALLALSREAATAYFEAYSGRASKIQSQMASGDYARPADLVALTTTSFYAVGSSQYNRLRLPPDLRSLRWSEVGVSRGYGTLHFSGETCKLLGDLLHVEGGYKFITSTFGEGPSERLRKLRDGMTMLHLPADDLLLHGMARLVYVATLTPATRPGVRAGGDPHHEAGPTIEAITAFWRDRWLAARLREPERLQVLRSFDPASVLLSTRFPAELELARAAATAHAEAK